MGFKVKCDGEKGRVTLASISFIIWVALPVYIRYIHKKETIDKEVTRGELLHKVSGWREEKEPAFYILYIIIPMTLKFEV